MHKKAPGATTPGAYLHRTHTASLKYTRTTTIAPNSSASAEHGNAVGLRCALVYTCRIGVDYCEVHTGNYQTVLC